MSKGSKSKSSKNDNTSVKVTNIIEEPDIKYFGTNSLRFTLTGSDVNHIFSNTIIRTIYSLVGCFAFHQDNITFTKNSSIFDPTHMKIRITNLAICFKDYEHDIMFPDFAEKCVQAEIEHDSNKTLTEIELIDKNNAKQASMINNIHMFVDAKNNGDDILNVTSNSQYVTFHKDGKVIPDIFPRPVQIVQLNPGKEINFVAKSDFSIPMVHNCYSTVHKCMHCEIDDHTYLFTVKSHRQIPERQIIKEACNIIIIKLNNVREKFIKALQEIPEKDSPIEIRLENENHTMGEIVNRGIQDHPKTRSCGCHMPHPDEKVVLFQINIEGMSVKKVIDEVIDKLIVNYSIVRDSF